MDEKRRNRNKKALQAPVKKGAEAYFVHQPFLENSVGGSGIHNLQGFVNI